MKLDAQGVLANQKVRCPGCKQIVTVPHAMTGNARPAPESKADQSDDEFLSSALVSDPSPILSDKTDICPQKSTPSTKPLGDKNSNLPDLDLHDRKSRSLLLYALSGILCPIPGFAAIPLIGLITEKMSGSWEGGVALIVFYLLGVAWTSSAVSAWICGRCLARRQGIAFYASVLLANASGWACFILAYPNFDFFDSGSAWLDFPYPLCLFVAWLMAIISLPSIFIASIGLLITWIIMKIARH
jgi:hypothetical protein